MMTRMVWNRTRLIISGLIGALVFGGAGLYWKFFSGQAEELKEGEFVVGNAAEEEKTKVTKEQLVIVKNKSPEEAVEEIARRTGDFDFIKPGQTILVKPNLNSGNPYPATTNPAVVAKVVELAYQKGAKKVFVGDFSGVLNPGTMKNFGSSGMLTAAKKAGAEVVAFDETGDWVRVKPELATLWPKGFRLPKLLFEVDHVISLPVLKRHGSTDYTLALKNWVGLLHMADRLLMHTAKDLPEKIAQISLAVKPSLIIIDGTKGFISGGPDTGEEVEINTFIGTFDPVAADVAGLNILKAHGAQLWEPDPWNQPQIKQALKSGVNTLSQEEIEEEMKSQWP